MFNMLNKMKFERLFLVIATNIALVQCFKNRSAGYMLYKHLIVDQEYNKNVRPVQNENTVTHVYLDLYIVSIVDFNEVSEQLSMVAKLEHGWTDEYLSWDPALFYGLEWIHLPQEEVWKPVIALENSVTKYQDLGTPAINVVVNNDGFVLWKPLELFQSSCTADVTKYPLDNQMCCLSFEAWSQLKGQVDTLNKTDRITLHHGYEGPPEWRITETHVQAMTTSEGEQYVTFCLTLQRQANYVILNIILPITLLSLLNCCVFLLPPSSGEKASFSVTVFLSLSVFLTVIGQQLPKTPNKVSLFNLYVSIQVLVSTMITIATLAQIRLYHRADSPSVPKWLQTLVSLCKQRKNEPKIHNCVIDENVNQDNKPECLPNEEANEYNDAGLEQVTWKQVAEWMDPVMFAIFTTLIVLYSLVLLACAFNL